MMDQKVTYREFKPDVRLLDYIKSYWYFSIRTGKNKTFDILPDGYFDLLVVIQEDKIVDTKLTGIWSKTVPVNYCKNTEVLGIRFKPFSIGGLFKFSLKNSLDNFHDVYLKDFDINEQLLLDGLNGFPEFLVNYLNAQFIKLTPANTPDTRLKNCFRLIDKHNGNITVDEISKNVGLSARQLYRLVNNMLGIGIKDYSKIIRFKRSLQSVKKNKTDYHYYYDQSHYIREIKKYTGLTPDKLDLNNNVRFIQYYDFAGL